MAWQLLLVNSTARRLAAPIKFQDIICKEQLLLELHLYQELKLTVIKSYEQVCLFCSLQLLLQCSTCQFSLPNQRSHEFSPPSLHLHKSGITHYSDSPTALCSGVWNISTRCRHMIILYRLGKEMPHSIAVHDARSRLSQYEGHMHHYSHPLTPGLLTD